MAPITAVSTFNSLPRPSTNTPTHPPSNRSTPAAASSPNHWHISIHAFPLSPPGDLLFLLQPSTGYYHVEGPHTLLSLSSATERAAVIAPLLLKAFNTGLGGYQLTAGAGGKTDTKRFCPSSWSTSDQELAEALSRELKRIGVRREARMVGVGKAEEEGKVREEWGRFKSGLDCVTRG